MFPCYQFCYRSWKKVNCIKKNLRSIFRIVEKLNNFFFFVSFSFFFLETIFSFAQILIYIKYLIVGMVASMPSPIVSPETSNSMYFLNDGKGFSVSCSIKDLTFFPSLYYFRIVIEILIIMLKFNKFILNQYYYLSFIFGSLEYLLYKLIFPADIIETVTL